jgi:ferredoxin-NADP reductase
MEREMESITPSLVRCARWLKRVKSCVPTCRPLPEDIEGRDFDAKGRVDAALLQSILPDLNAEFYLCGPIVFMADLQTELEQFGVPSDQIHSESFGPA